MATTCKTLAKSFDWCPGKVELPGVLGTIYYTPLINCVKLPSLPVDELGRPTSTVLDGAFEMAEGTTFYNIDCLPRKNHYTSEAQGQLPSQSQVNKLTAVIPSTGPEASEIGACVNNVPCVFIFRSSNGDARVLGIGFSPAKATFAQDGGEDVSGNVTSTLSVESYDLTVAPFYKGSIETPSGTVSFGDSAA